MKKLIVASAAVALALGMSAPAFAKTGYSQTTTSTQGSSGKPAKLNNNQGTTDVTVTTTGPYGQVKQGKSANTTTTTTSSGPGNSTKMP